MANASSLRPSTGDVPADWRKANPSSGLDRAVGMALMGVAGLVFMYYTLWVVILPFVEEDHLLQQFFLPRIYAVWIPLAAGFIVLAGLGAFIGAVMMKKTTKTS